MRHILKVIDNTREAVEDFLMELAVNDNDFNGENGPEYLWECAEGYECNADYALERARREDTTKDMIHEFIKTWMGNDSYYDDYDIEILEFENKLAISFVYIEAI